MQTVKWKNQDITIYCSGDTIRLFVNEFHTDLFQEFERFYANSSRGKIEFTNISKLFYIFAKTANSEIFKSYNEFLSSILKLSELNDEKIVYAIMAEVNETMNIGKKDNEEKDDEDSKKKKTSTVKKK